jgi:transcriptional regulator with XRE-family HTH domain
VAATEIAKWLKRQRQKRRLSQAALADALGKSRSWVSGIERGAMVQPKVEDCALLADYFQAPVRDVLGLAGYPLSEIAALGPVGAGGREDGRGRYLSDQELEDLLQRAAERAVRAVLSELRADRGG